MHPRKTSSQGRCRAAVKRRVYGKGVQNDTLLNTRVNTSASKCKYGLHHMCISALIAFIPLKDPKALLMKGRSFRQYFGF